MENGHTDHCGACHGTLKSYLVGFVLSLILTVVPFWMVMDGGYSDTAVLVTIVALAVVQVFVHLIYFLHMNNKSEQRWNVLAFVFTVLIAAFLIGGSIWIMENVNNNLMPASTNLNTEE